MASLPGVGTISYNGFAFDGPMVSSRASIENIRGDDDRAVIFSEISVEVHATIDLENCGILQGDLPDGYMSTIDDIVRALSQDGKAFVFTDKIFERLAVNTGETGDYVDVNYGPRVKVVSLVPVVANRVFEIVWTARVAVAKCPGTDVILSEGAVRQFVYGCQWSGDSRGYSTRTVSGFIEIVSVPAMSDDQITISADDYREKLTVAMPEGYRRVQNHWQLEPNKSRINFAITDEEIPSPNAYPPDVVDIEISHQVSVGQSTAFSQAVSILSGHCEVANGFTSSDAWERVFPIISARIQRARTNVGAIMLLDISVTEYLYSRRIAFQITYQKLGTSPSGFIKSSGLFSATDDTWSEYRASMYGPDENTNDTDLPWSRRSMSNLSFEPSDDKIVTPCTEQPFDVIVHNQRLTPFTNPLQSVLSNSCPPRNKSYAIYESRLKTETASGATSVYEMPTASTSFTPESAKTTDGATISAGLDASEQRIRTFDASAVSPDMTMTLVGHAARLGYPVEIPKIAETSGITVKRVRGGDKIEQKSFMYMGCRMYMAKWNIKYKITESATDAAARIGNSFDLLNQTTDYPSGGQMDVV